VIRTNSSMPATVIHAATAQNARLNDASKPPLPDALDPHTRRERIEQPARVAELEAEVQLYRGILARVIHVTAEAAQGNLETRLLHFDGSDKFGGLARSINHLLDMIDAFLREAGAALEYASHEKFFRRVLLRGMRGTVRHKSELINEATEKMARNAASLQTVEQLVRDSSGIAQGAVRDATDAMAIMQQLGEASQRIATEVKSISQVAWQTKLLAFNAKIEAGRAGQLGRGFDGRRARGKRVGTTNRAGHRGHIA